MQVVLQAQGLVKRYKDKLAVDGVDLAVRPGERVALLGPNGAGKTTTLMMLLGVISPDSGWVEVAGHRFPGGRSEALEQVGFSAGYMPLAERLRVREFLKMYAELYGVRHPEGRIAAGLERFRVPELSEVMGTELSSGQRTLVGIIKATLHHPRLLILDEPTASLDPDVALRVRNGLMELCREQGTALLITSHNMVEIQRLCDRVVFLSAGRIIADDEPDAVAERFGRADLEGVFLHLADGGHEEPRRQETDRPA
ncbi:MAG: ABC transporter ATP-binding protein [Actinobacteria bacterium]|nr:ABC transporter ATP-binding protein [Actinomycetota bacterium]